MNFELLLQLMKISFGRHYYYELARRYGISQLFPDPHEHAIKQTSYLHPSSPINSFHKHSDRARVKRTLKKENNSPDTCILHFTADLPQV